MDLDTAQTNPKWLLEVKDLSKHYPLKGGFFDRVKGTVKAVDGINFQIAPGETVGLVGESGCGKTTTGRLILKVLETTTGEIWYQDDEVGRLDIAQLSHRNMHPLRRKIQMIFQDPYSSLDPRMTILQIVGEPLRSNHIASGNDYKDRVAQALQWVGMRPEYMSRYPHAFSGGQRQRIGIARALVTQPKLVVADEPVSALDVSIQAQILNLLQDLQSNFNLTYLFIAHDLSVIRHICDRVIVMYVGKIVESSPKNELFSRPRHPYTEALLSAVPRPDPRRNAEPLLSPGEVADPANPPSGCYFHPRCRFARDICREKMPDLSEASPGHWSACHFSKEITLQGV
jgi:peptide/nickel transport system ATP-binding protein